MILSTDHRLPDCPACNQVTKMLSEPKKEPTTFRVVCSDASCIINQWSFSEPTKRAAIKAWKLVCKKWKDPKSKIFR